MSANEYNGWANHATWNIALWVDNDESLYGMMLREWPIEPDHDGLDAKRLAGRLFADGMTTDGVNIADSSIAWVEIAEAWDEACELDNDEPESGLAVDVLRNISDPQWLADALTHVPSPILGDALRIGGYVSDPRDE